MKWQFLFALLAATPSMATQSAQDAADDLWTEAEMALGEMEELSLSDSMSLGNSLELTDEDIRDWAMEGSIHRSYPVPLLTRWEEMLRRRLIEEDVAAVSTSIADEFHMSASDMELLIRRWVTAFYRYYPTQGENEQRDQIREDLLAIVQRSGHAAVAVEAAADALDELLECDRETFASLLEGSRDRAADAWRIVSVAPCNGSFLTYLESTPDHPVPALIRLADYGTLRPSGALSVYAWLTSEAGLAHIDLDHRSQMAATLNRRYVALLLEVGLADRAVALLDSMTPADRAQVLNPAPDVFVVRADGLPVYVTPSREVRSMPLDLAIVYFLAGRRAESEQLLQLVESRDEARAAFECLWDPSPQSDGGSCSRSFGLPMEILALEHLMYRPEDDPYPLAEILFSGGLVHGSSGPRAELRCRLLDDAQYASICDDARRSVGWNIGMDVFPENHSQAMTAIETLSLPGWLEERASISAELETIRSLENSHTAGNNRANQLAIDPDPPSFVLNPLPPRYRGDSEEEIEWPTDFSGWPEGYRPVRWEIEDERTVVVSLSQMLDPTGEISAGGYWIHISHDGGQSWEVPLYTGLSEHFPYVVKPRSRMPLIDGDDLNVEVEIAEIDTRSISYPPVGLRTRRREANIYLEIPLSTLRRDSDGNGLSDLVERHLLLDRHENETATPYIVGSADSVSCPAEPDLLTRARMRIFEQLFDMPNRAIVEPVDRTNEMPLMRDWRRATSGVAQPLFVSGNPSDFTCLRSDRLIIVYGAEDIAALQRHAPDFRTIELPQITLNRAGDRGYVIWSAGWRGGTLRLRLVEGEWAVDEISNWIS